MDEHVISDPVSKRRKTFQTQTVLNNSLAKGVPSHRNKWAMKNRKRPTESTKVPASFEFL